MADQNSDRAAATQASDPAVDITGLTIAYRSGGRDVVVVDDVDLQVRPGRTTALVGESGSGKSTVAGSMLGHLRTGSRLVRGRVHVGGVDVLGLGAAELRDFRSSRVAMVPQNAGHALTPSMRVGRQVGEVSAIRGLGADERSGRIEEAFGQVGLAPGLVRRFPHQLSGGQQQRVAIAMALVARPDVLVLDEPTTGLDVVTQRDILGLLRELSRELGTATVLVSHDLGVVAALADDIAIMHAGRIVEHAGAEQLFRAPGHEHTRSLLASVPRLPERGVAVAPTVAADVTADPEAPVDPVVAVRHAVVGYGRGTGSVAVDDVSLELRRGHVLALVGQSGSGKSTLAWSMAGLHPLRSGEMTYLADGGHDLGRPARRRPRDLRRRVQMVFQNADTSLNPRRVVSSAIRRPLTFFGTAEGARTDDAVGAVADDVQLPRQLLGRLPAQLSGGQRQRVGIGRALAARPEVLIADEITTALDVSVQAQILTLLDRLRREHDLACLFISHDLAVVHDVAHHVVVLYRGRVVEQGPTAAVFAGPNHPYTFELLAATLEPDPALARATVAGGGAVLGNGIAGNPDDDGPPPGQNEWETTDGMADLGGGHRVRRWRRVEARPQAESG